MLTVFEANFIQEYKKTGSPTKALRNAGHTCSEKSLPVLAYRMIRKPHIKKVLEEYQANLNQAVTEPVLIKPRPMSNTKEGIVKANIPRVAVPSKNAYVEVAWKRSSDESRLKEETKYKYFENAGKVLGYIGKESSEGEKPLLQMVIGELNITEIIGHEKTPSLENPASDFVIDQTPNTPLPPSDNTHGTHQEDKGFDVVPILNGSSLEKSEGLAGGGQGPQEGESISVNPLPNPPTILNSVNGENTRV